MHMLTRTNHHLPSFHATINTTTVAMMVMKIFHCYHGFIPLLLSCLFLLHHQFCHSIRLLTWNLLAPIYATPTKYPFACCQTTAAGTTTKTFNHLDWKTARQPKIIQTLLQSQADLICLQEIQLDLWDEFWHEFCSAASATTAAATTATTSASDCSNKKLPTTTATTTHSYNSYTAVVQNVTRQHPVACAILVKQTSFRVLRVESRSRACLVVLEAEEKEQQQAKKTTTGKKQQPPQCELDDTSSSSFSTRNNKQLSSSSSSSPASREAKKTKKKRLYLATVHLEAGYEKQDTRWNQIKSLLKRCYRHMELDVAADEEDNDDRYKSNKDIAAAIAQQPLILAGDFNMWTRQCALYHTLVGMETDNYLDMFRHHKRSDNNKNNNNNEKETTSCTWETTLLPLHNVHQHDRPPLTYAGGSVLDYCWERNLLDYKPYWPVLQQQQQHPLELVEFSDHATEDELMPAQAWPSQHVPSDHLPIGVEFCL